MARSRPPAGLFLPILREFGVTADPGGCIVVLGSDAPPPPNPYSFEPVIVCPRTFPFNQRLIYVLLPAIVAISLVPVLPAGTGRAFLGCGGFSLMVGLLFALTARSADWLSSAVVKGEYIRVAPGSVEFIRYGFRSRDPRVRSYPMGAGTVVVVASPGTTRHVTFLRDGNQDQIVVSTHLPMELVWRALMSTARTPPLPPDALVG